MDKEAFEARALGCARRLHGIAYAMLGSEADCEDAVSEALLKAWLRLDSLREARYFETWLTRILLRFDGCVCDLCCSHIHHAE